MEVDRCGVPSEVVSTRILPAWESIQKYALASGEWYDAYCGVIRRETSTKKDPFQPSMGAGFSYTLVDGEIRYHAPVNLVITSLYVNFLKYAYIPAMLAHIVSYGKSERGDMPRNTFLGKMENVYLVSLKIPFFKKKRLENVPSTTAYTARRREYISRNPDGQGHGKIRYTREDYWGITLRSCRRGGYQRVLDVSQL